MDLPGSIGRLIPRGDDDDAWVDTVRVLSEPVLAAAQFSTFYPDDYGDLVVAVTPRNVHVFGVREDQGTGALGNEFLRSARADVTAVRALWIRFPLLFQNRFDVTLGPMDDTRGTTLHLRYDVLDYEAREVIKLLTERGSG